MVSVTSQYAMRALVHLTRLPSGAFVLGRDLAREARIPANYLSKIMLTLRNAGLVEATRGQGGGYRMARAASGIALAEVVRLFEGIQSEPGCLLGERDVCSDEEPCSAHAAWKEVRMAYLDFLSSTTVSDIATCGTPAGSGKLPVSSQQSDSKVGLV